MSYSAIRGFSKTQHGTRFKLSSDLSNKYRVAPVVANTVHMPNSIPFLRDQRNVSNLTFAKVNDAPSFTMR